MRVFPIIVAAILAVVLVDAHPAEEPVPDPQKHPAWNVFKDLGHGTTTTLSDLGYVYSSPARMTKRSALVLGGMVAVWGLLYAYDQEIYDALQRNQFKQPYKPIREAGEFFEPLGFQGEVNKYIIAALLLGYATRFEPIVTVSSDIIESFIVASPGKRLGNIVAGRRGPLNEKGARSFKFNDGRSLPSGHSVTIVAMMGVLTHHVDSLPFDVVGYTIAGTVLLQRITSDHHWPSDVWAGALWGWFVSREMLKHRVSESVEIGAVSGGRGLGVAVRF